jgi:hypothetical protein
MNRISERAVRALVRALPLLSILALVVGLGAGAYRAAAQTQPNVGVLGGNGMRGISFVHTPAAPFGSEASADSLRRLAATGANWVSVVAPFRINNAHDSVFYRSPNEPDIASIAQVIVLAHSLGMKVMLQPVVLANDGVWNGYFEPDNKDAWFTNYRTAIEEYARLAQQTSVDLFWIGTEFFTLTKPQFSGQWRDLISAVRRDYYGPLTYSANWGDKKTPEYATIDWWDQLDYIGISAYFPLSWNNFNIDALAQGWYRYQDPFGTNAQGQTFNWFNDMSALRGRWNKPLLFTKIGFASYANSPGRWDVRPDPYIELSVQANGYEATMQVWSRIDWMQGIFWSPWYSTPNAGGPRDNSESPQNKPAEQVLQRWYSGQH